MQKSHEDFDLHIIYIRGNGECRDRESYKEFYEIVDKNNDLNIQLTPDDTRIIDIIEGTRFEPQFHEHENDHGLDSGAWYQFIRSGKWHQYDYVFCFMEGFLFTGTTVFSSITRYLADTRVDFLDMGFEKRLLTPYAVENYLTRGPNPTELDYFHQKQWNTVFSSFRRDAVFKDLYDKWNDNQAVKTVDIGKTEYHVPRNTYGPRDLTRLLRTTGLTPDLVSFLVRGERILSTSDGVIGFEDRANISDEWKNYGGIRFHLETNPYYFGCMCQHVFSKNFLNSLNTALDNNNLYNVMNLPFSASPVEVIWGLMPAWLGYTKWYFDGVYRPRKNFFSYARQDDPRSISYYLNRYYHRDLTVHADGDKIRINRLSKKRKDVRSTLGDLFFSDNR